MARPVITVIVLAALLAPAVAWDLRRRRIPNALVMALLFSALASRLWQAGFTGLGIAAGSAVVLVALLAMPWARGWIGGGDVKLAAACVAWLPPSHWHVFVLASALAGGVLSGAAFLFSTRAARAEIRANLLGARLDGRLATIEAAPGRVSVPYAVAIACGMATAIALGG